MKSLATFWQFSRPHTIIGSFCSITALFLLALEGQPIAPHLGLYGLTLLSALACNVFIVGLNQLTDVELDKINKPYLPLAAGSFQKRTAHIIVYASLLIALFSAAFVSKLLFLVISSILLIGVAYSVPPLRLKKHHLPAAICISLVRGIIVNVGMLLHFTRSIHGQAALPGGAWPITIFVTAFSIAIAWFKDLPDTAGDAAFEIKTFPILYNKHVALITGALLVLMAYAYAIIWSYYHSPFLLWAHGILAALFILNLCTVKLNHQASIKGFYLRFWVFFFAEYAAFSAYALLVQN